MDYVIPDSTKFYLKTVLSKNDGKSSDLSIFIKLKIVIAMILIKDFINKIMYFLMWALMIQEVVSIRWWFDLLYTKDNNDNIWSKLDFSIIDPFFKFRLNTQKFDTFLPLDISHSLIYKSEDYGGNDYEIGGDISSSFGIPKIYIA